MEARTHPRQPGFFVSNARHFFVNFPTVELVITCTLLTRSDHDEFLQVMNGPAWVIP